MRSFINKYYHHDYKYPVKMWCLAESDGKPMAVIYDGAILRLINLETKRILKSYEYHQINAFSECIYARVNIYRFDSLYLLAYQQKQIKAFDENLNEIPQANFDCGMAILALHWVPETANLYIAGTNGWLKCYHLTCKAHIADFIAKWTLVFEIRSTEDWIVSLAHDNFTQTLYGIANTTLYAWELGTGIFKFRLPDLHDKFKLCQVAVIPESNLIVTSALDGTVKLWNVQISVCKLYFTVPSFYLGYTSFRVKDRFIITNSADRTIRLFRIGNEYPLSSLDLSDSARQKSYDEVVIVKLDTIPLLNGEEGYMCLTSYKNQLDCVTIGFVPEDYITSNYPIINMAYVADLKKIICICENNLLITAIPDQENPDTVDLDMIPKTKTKRSTASDTLCLCQCSDSLITGHKNGSLKLIDVQTFEGFMIETVDLDDSILCMDSCQGMFNSNHQTCGVNQDRTYQDQDYVVAMSKSGSVHVWCTRCGLNVIDQKLNKKDAVKIQVVPKHKLAFIASENTVSCYKSNGYSFIPVSQLSTSGNQLISTFIVTQDLTLIVGTTTGEIIIANIEYEEQESTYHINIHHILTPGCSSTKEIFMCADNLICACCFSDGQLFMFETKYYMTMASDYFTDAAPLSSVLFTYKEENLKVFMAFGEHVHCYQLTTDIPDPPVVEEVKEEEQVVVAPVHHSSSEDEEIQMPFTNLKDSKNNASDEDFVMNVRKYKNTDEFNLIDSRIASKITYDKLPQQRPKLTLEEATAKNEEEIKRILGNNKDKKKPKVTKKKRPQTSLTSRNTQERPRGLDLTLTNFSYKDVQKPKALSELQKEINNSTKSRTTLNNSELSSRSQKLSTQTLVINDNNKNKWAEITYNDDITTQNIEDPSLMFPTQAGRWMMISTEKRELKSTTPTATLNKAFIAPPLGSKILFDDQTTLNSLPYFDPRGFSMKFESEEEKMKRLEEEKQQKEARRLAMRESQLSKSARPVPRPNIPIKKDEEATEIIENEEENQNEAEEEKEQEKPQEQQKKKKNYYPMKRKTVSRFSKMMNSAPIPINVEPKTSSIPSHVVSKSNSQKKIVFENNKENDETVLIRPEFTIPSKLPTTPRDDKPPKQEGTLIKPVEVTKDNKNEPPIVITTKPSLQNQKAKKDVVLERPDMDANNFNNFNEQEVISSTRKQHEKQQTVQVKRKEKQTNNKLPDNKINRFDKKKLQSTIGHKVQNMDPKKYVIPKAREQNEMVKKAMYSRKPAPKKEEKPKYEKDKNKPEKEEKEEIEETVEEKPEKSTLIKKNPSVTLQKDQPPPITTELKRKPRKWEDNGIDFSFGDGGFKESETPRKTFEMSDYLPNLKPFWDQKHIYPELPIERVSKLAPKDGKVNTNNLDEKYPDVSPVLFVKKNFLEDFERFYAFQTGTDAELDQGATFGAFDVPYRKRRLSA
ncbi:hypothetical protein TVAG_411400 [Trichomonas vaginalis G3]|uniref:Uncharacterized protein n=1 Tax=Trichomonas vaginalis (strain ATCC PRA-98 / G3) TaxID=412133 RepID=A2DXP5_TRIV3|nr:WD repeat-containing protein 61 family [Trichomonas vaginalis G3]EAY14874.1 hypothetical protein TVAG_411400 [Trichomonas vaginalis G3]KAI5541145.1 WD repeat-containing protein 61 family [Trichomonas vaginalis G3]|eukprot:XP_001327097.1 hypothetical protein [Trichomonas vaginalis G3]